MGGSKRDTVVKSRFLDYVGEDEGEVILKKRVYYHMKNITSASFIYEEEHSKPVL